MSLRYTEGGFWDPKAKDWKASEIGKAMRMLYDHANGDGPLEEIYNMLYGALESQAAPALASLPSPAPARDAIETTLHVDESTPPELRASLEHLVRAAHKHVKDQDWIEAAEARFLQHKNICTTIRKAIEYGRKKGQLDGSPTGSPPLRAPEGEAVACRETDGGFICEVAGREVFTCSRGSNAIDLNPMDLETAKACLFALGSMLLRIDERSESVEAKPEPSKSPSQSPPVTSPLPHPQPPGGTEA